jgi:hypothetical protein
VSKTGEVNDAEIVASDFPEEAPEMDKAIRDGLEGLNLGPNERDFAGSYIFTFKRK